MTPILFFLLWLFIGTCASILLTFVCVFPIHGLLKLANDFGLRLGHPAKQRLRNALIVLTAVIAVMVVGFWLSSVLVGNVLELSHTTALQCGVVLGGGGLGAMLWVFVGASLSQTIKDP